MATEVRASAEALTDLKARLLARIDKHFRAHPDGVCNCSDPDIALLRECVEPVAYLADLRGKKCLDCDKPVDDPRYDLCSHCDEVSIDRD